MSVTKVQALEEINPKMNFSAVPNPGPFKEIIGSVASFLSDPESYKTALKALSDSFDEREKALKGKKQLDDTGDTKVGRVLSSILAEAEEVNGFTLIQTGSDQHAVKRALLLTDFLQPADFRQIIKDKKPFKDPTVPFGHGEFTHRIQWYLVMKDEGLAKIKSSNGGMKWADVYSSVGDVVHSSSTLPGDEEWSDLGLWDAVFDRNRNHPDYINANGPYNTTDEGDARSPENLLAILTSDQWLATGLGRFLWTREQKREAMFQPTAQIEELRAKFKLNAVRSYVISKMRACKMIPEDVEDDDKMPDRIQKEIENIMKSKTFSYDGTLVRN